MCWQLVTALHLRAWGDVVVGNKEEQKKCWRNINMIMWCRSLNELVNIFNSYQSAFNVSTSTVNAHTTSISTAVATGTGSQYVLVCFIIFFSINLLIIVTVEYAFYATVMAPRSNQDNNSNPRRRRQLGHVSSHRCFFFLILLFFNNILALFCLQTQLAQAMFGHHHHHSPLYGNNQQRQQELVTRQWRRHSWWPSSLLQGWPSAQSTIQSFGSHSVATVNDDDSDWGSRQPPPTPTPLYGIHHHESSRLVGGFFYLSYHDVASSTTNERWGSRLRWVELQIIILNSLKLLIEL